MGNRVEQEREFLCELLDANTTRKEKKIIKEANAEQIKCIFEIIENCPKLVYTKKEEKDFGKCRSVLKNFFKQKWNVVKLRKFYSKNHDKIMCIICIVVNKITQARLCSSLDN